MSRLPGVMAFGTGDSIANLPPGLMSGLCTRASYSQEIARDVELAVLRSQHGLPLDPIIRWIAQHQSSRPDQRAIVLLRRLGTIWPSSLVQQTLGRHFRDDVTHSNTDGDQELHFVGSRVTVVDRSDRRALNEVLPVDHAIHLLLSDHLLDELTRGARDILQQRLDGPVAHTRWGQRRVGRSGGRRTSVGVRTRLTAYEAGFSSGGAPATGRWPAAATDIADALDLAGRRVELRRQLEELAALEQADADHGMESLLFAIGLAGVTGAVLNWLALDELVRWDWRTLGWILLVDGPLIAAFLILWRRDSRR